MRLGARGKGWLAGVGAVAFVALFWARSLGWLGRPVAFATLSKGPSLFNLYGNMPALFVVSEPWHVDELVNHFGFEADQDLTRNPATIALRQMDYENRFAILVIGGFERITITRIVQVGGRIAVHAEVDFPVEIGLDYARGPFHLVRLEKRNFAGYIGPGWQFELWVGWNEVMQVQQFIRSSPSPTAWPTIAYP